MSEMKAVALAAKSPDWKQVALNGGPPCFHVCEDGHFCFRAERWPGHIAPEPMHEHVSLESMLTRLQPSEREKRLEAAFADAVELAEYASYAEIVGGVSVNRPAVRKFCDKVMDHKKAFRIEEDAAEDANEALNQE